MGIVAVGGQARKVGKTSVVAGIIAALPERRWTAVKITQCHHAEADCHCELRGSAFAVNEEFDRLADTDSSRYLRAGAERSFWVRVREGQLTQVVPSLQELVRDSNDLILESSRIPEHLRCDLFLCVASSTQDEEKPQWAHLLTLADALILPHEALPHASGLRTFVQTDPDFVLEVAKFVHSHV